MRRRLVSFVLPVVLAGTAALLAARLIDEARMLGQAAAVETAAVGGDGLAMALESEMILPDPAPPESIRVAEVLERPLFSPTRRPPVMVAVQAAPDPAADAKRPDLQLHGIIVVGDVRMALLGEDAGAALLRVQAGDRVGDWEVIEIGTKEVVLQSGKETHRMGLDYRNGAE